jgi:hypothetical protein
VAGFGIVLILTGESPGLLQPGPPTRRLLSKSAASFACQASPGATPVPTGQATPVPTGVQLCAP